MTTGGDNTQTFKASKISLHILKQSKFKLFDFIKDILVLSYFCRVNRINIIHSHHRYFDFVSSFVCYFSKVRTIITVHSKVEGNKKFSYKSERIIAVSESIKMHLVKKFNISASKISVINNFIITDKVYGSNASAMDKKKLGIKGNKNYRIHR